MKFIFCVDKNNGLLFGWRRQSQDSVLREKMLEYVGEARLLVSEYTAKQFDTGVVVDNDYLSLAEDDAYCFVEDGDYDLSVADEVVLFLWNREYPADKFLEFEPKSMGFKRVQKTDFEGSSHKKITMEVYKR